MEKIITRTSDGEKVYEKQDVVVKAILNGSVFDHLFPGTGIDFIRTLENIVEPKSVEKLKTKRAILQYVSSRYEQKDVVKFTDIIFSESVLKELYKKYPRFTYSVIENGCVVEKYADMTLRIRQPQALQANLQRTLDSHSQ